jgi:uncharacterized repeat protein (TIGR03803 family)
MGQIVHTLGKLNWVRPCVVFVLCAATAIAVPGQTFTTLVGFDGTDGAAPYAGVIQATDGNFYGTTVGGGASNYGTVFKMTASGTVTTLYSFCSQSGCTDGSRPYAGLIQASDGDFYGTTEGGGKRNKGTVFRITSSGALTTLHSFCSQSDCADGAYPDGALVQASDGDFYGTTYGVQGIDTLAGYGTVFKITPSGALTTLHNFCSQSGCTDGINPQAGLVQAANGDLYGTTQNGGAYGLSYGTVFKITPSGTLTTLHSFCAQTNSEGFCTDGYAPYAKLVQALNGDLYGTTNVGGVTDDGTVFKITPGGALTTFYSFCAQSGCPDGEIPQAALVQATNGDLYGTTPGGGIVGHCVVSFGCGTIFEITPGGGLTTLYSFCFQDRCTDGAEPSALFQATDGNFYGTTGHFGVSGGGTAFSLSVGLGPFVETQTTFGNVGAAVNILGTDLTGATSVTFNGTAAQFTVVSPSLITTTVPSGATTGTIQVVTPGGTLSSNVPFRVLP